MFRIAFTTASRQNIVPLRSFAAARAFGTKPPGGDPLDLIRKECVARNLCDEYGYRRPGVHWVFSVAITPDDANLVSVSSRFVVRLFAGCSDAEQHSHIVFCVSHVPADALVSIKIRKLPSLQ
jgi:hypothetical protein